jgi:hypothetical protein
MKTILGFWSKTGNTITGTVDASEKALAVEGSELDQNYTHEAQVTVPSGGKAGLIVNHTYDSSWNESYLAVYLDQVNNVVTLEYVVRDQTGTEVSREILDQRVFPVTAGAAYYLAVESEVLSDGSFAVYGKVNGFTVVEAEDLEVPLNAGQRGFEVLTGANASFNYVAPSPFDSWVPFQPAFTTLSEVVGHLNAAGPDSNGNYTVYGLPIGAASFQSQVDHANKYITSLVPSLLGPGFVDPREASAELAATDLACLGVLVTSVGGSLVGVYDYFLGDMHVARSAPYASAIKVAIDGYSKSAASNLNNLSTVAVGAKAVLGRMSPRQCRGHGW